jgi:hypothetical protein
VAHVPITQRMPAGHSALKMHESGLLAQLPSAPASTAALTARSDLARCVTRTPPK